MQESVTQYGSKIKLKPKKFIFFVILFLLVLVIVLGGIIALSVNTKKYYFVDGMEYYIYYTHRESSLSRAESLADTQKKNGGAGFIVEKNGFYVCAFLYKDKIGAQTVKENNNESYPEGGVITQNTQKLTKRAKNIMKNNQNYASCIHGFEDAFNEFYDLALKCDSQNLSEVEVFNAVFLRYEKINSLSVKFEDANSPFSLAVDSLAILVKDYLTSSKTAVERSSGLKEICFEIINLYNLVAGWLCEQ